jgi:c-di-AMP phosphodiesterase-like protein
MRYLLLSSCLFFIAGCSRVYENLQPAKGDISAIEKLKPDFKATLYKAQINVTSHHLSGLLLIKILPDSSTRVVFSNEMGLKFFDFEFKPNGDFKVYYVIEQMNKKPVIKTLKKDFELILLLKQDNKTGFLRKDSQYLYYIFPKKKGYYCYVTDTTNTRIVRMEIASPRRPIVEAVADNYNKGIPDTIGITHKNFNFTIGLKKIER